jgi:REP element-mobilizing transposase RayT
VHANALMTDHVHLLLTAETTEGVGQLMKALAGNVVRSISTARIGAAGRCGRAASGHAVQPEVGNKGIKLVIDTEGK